MNAELDKMSEQQYREKCTRLGMPPGSPSYDECFLQQQRLEAEQISNMTTIEAANTIAGKK